MKIKDGFVLRKIAGDYVVVPTGQEIVDFKAIITLNETAAFMWEKLLCDITVDDLVEETIKEFDVDKETARDDIVELINILKEKKILD